MQAVHSEDERSAFLTRYYKIRSFVQQLGVALSPIFFYQVLLHKDLCYGFICCGSMDFLAVDLIRIF